MDIVKGIFNGDTEFAISQNLRISEHTVHARIKRVHEKLQVHDLLLISAPFLLARRLRA